MARQYIEIDSESDIELDKITLSSINNRYIDNEGRRYATKFNLRTRKIQIIRIALGKDEAQQARKGSNSLENDMNFTPADSGGSMPLPDWCAKENLMPNPAVDTHHLVHNLENECNKMSERIRGVISNMKNSEVFEIGTSHSDGQDFILELTNFYDHEIQENLNQTQNFAVEFVRFPKPASNYFIHLARKEKMFVENLEDEEQMEYFQAYMVGQSYLKALNSSIQLIIKIRTRLESNPSAQVAYEKKSFFENGVEAMDFAFNHLRDTIEDVLGWMQLTKVY